MAGVLGGSREGEKGRTSMKQGEKAGSSRLRDLREAWRRV